MTNRYVLIEASPTIDSLNLKPICAHAILDDDDRIVGRHAIFGVYGDWSKRDEDFSPFVLGSDGRIDYGYGWEMADSVSRYAQTNLREVVVREGQIFEYVSADGSHRYRIGAINSLPYGAK